MSGESNERAVATPSGGRRKLSSSASFEAERGAWGVTVSEHIHKKTHRGEAGIKHQEEGGSDTVVRASN